MPTKQRFPLRSRRRPATSRKTFDAMAGTAYHVWARLRAEDDSLSNDSVHVQFSDAVTSAGSPGLRIGTSSSAEFLLQDGPTGSGNSAWGWTDNGWGEPGSLIYFAATGTHTLRIQAREDGAFVDQIVLSPDTYIINAPGRATATATMLPEGTASPGTTCTDPSATNYGGPAPCTYPAPPPAANNDRGRVSGEGALQRQLAAVTDATAARRRRHLESERQPGEGRAGAGGARELCRRDVPRDGRHRVSRLGANARGRRLAVERLGPPAVQRLGDVGRRRDPAIGTSSSAEFVLQNGSSGPADTAGAGPTTAGAPRHADLFRGDSARTRSASSSARTARSSIRWC